MKWTSNTPSRLPQSKSMLDHYLFLVSCLACAAANDSNELIRRCTYAFSHYRCWWWIIHQKSAVAHIGKEWTAFNQGGFDVGDLSDHKWAKPLSEQLPVYKRVNTAISPRLPSGLHTHCPSIVSALGASFNERTTSFSPLFEVFFFSQGGVRSGEGSIFFALHSHNDNTWIPI